MSALAGLLVAVGFQVLVAVGGLLMPGSILAHPFSIKASEPITVVYDFPGGRVLLFGTLALLSIGFLACLRATARLGSRRATTWVLVAAIPLVAVFVLVYPTGSTDLFHNIADARTLWKYHELPIVTPPNAHPDDPIVQHVPVWRDTTTKYGPLAYVPVGIPSLLAGDNLLLNLILFKVYNGVLLLLLACLVGWAASHLSPGYEAEATATVALNPLLLYEAVANGHNDVLMAVFAVLALVLTWRQKTISSLAALAVGAGVKFVTALLAPLTWAWLWLNGDSRDRAVLATLGLGGVIMAGVAYTQFSDRIFAGAGPAAGQGVVGSPMSVIVYALEPWLGLSGIPLARGVCFVAFGALVLGLLGRLRRAPDSLWRAWVWILLGLIVLTATQVYPWYLMWVIPLAAIKPGTRESDVAVISSIAGLVAYVFWPWVPEEIVAGDLHPNAAYNFGYGLAFFVGPTLYLTLARRLNLPTTASIFGGERLPGNDPVEPLLARAQDDRAIP